MGAHIALALLSSAVVVDGKFGVCGRGRNKLTIYTNRHLQLHFDRQTSKTQKILYTKIIQMIQTNTMPSTEETIRKYGDYAKLFRSPDDQMRWARLERNPKAALARDPDRHPKRKHRRPAKVFEYEFFNYDMLQPTVDPKTGRTVFPVALYTNWRYEHIINKEYFLLTPSFFSKNIILSQRAAAIRTQQFGSGNLLKSLLYLS